MAEGEMARTLRRSAEIAAEFEAWIPSFIESYRADPLGVLLIVPSRAACDTVWDAMLKQGLAIVGTPVATLPEIVERLFFEWNVDGIKIERYEAELALSRLLREGLDSLPEFDQYEGDIGHIVPGLYDLVNTVRDHGLDYPACAGAENSLHLHLGPLLESYLAYLEKHGLFDERARFKWVAGTLRSKGQVWKRLSIFDPGPDSPLALQVLQALTVASAKAEIIASPFWPFDDAGRAFLDRFSPSVEPSVRAASDGSAPKEVFRNTFSDRRDEAAFVAGRIRQLIDEGVGPGEIAVLPPSEEWRPIIQHALEDVNVQCNAGQKKGLLASPLVRALDRLFYLPLDDYPRADLIQVFRSPYIRFSIKDGVDVSSLYASRLDRYSRNAGIVRGRDNWVPALRRLADREEKRKEETGTGEGPEKIREAADLMAAFLAEMDKITGLMSDTERVRRLRSLLKTVGLDRHAHCPERDVFAREARALSGLDGVLESIVKADSFFGDTVRDLGDFLDSFTMTCQEQEFRQEDDHDTAVEVIGIRHAGLLRRDHIFIPGLVEGAMPFFASPARLISDAESYSWGIDSRDLALNRERYRFEGGMGAARRSLQLTCSKATDKEVLIPSEFFVSMDGAAAHPATASFRSKSTSAFELGRCISGQAPPISQSLRLHTSMEDVLARAKAEAMHCSGPYSNEVAGDCFIFGQEAALRDSALREHSASMLEDYSLCPFKYLMRRVYHFKEREEPQEDAEASSQGIVLHEVLRRYHDALRAKGISKVNEENAEAAHSIMAQVAGSVVDAAPYSGPVWQGFRSKLIGNNGSRRGILHTYVELEARDETGFIPVASEWEFKGVAIPLPSCQIAEMKVQGMVDRIDQCPSGSEEDLLFITDFKSGRSPDNGAVREMKALQLPLYSYVAAKEFRNGGKTIPAGASFFSFKDEAKLESTTVVASKGFEELMEKKTGKATRYQLELDTSLVPKRLAEIAGGIVSGRFHPSDSGKDLKGDPCGRYCPFREACRFDEFRLLATASESGTQLCGEAPAMLSDGGVASFAAQDVKDDEKRIDPDKSACVTAGAGAGKTKMLVDLFTDILRDGKATVDEILAITFTKKAAAEMKERIRTAIDEMEPGATRDKAKEDFYWCHISTFHSLCTDILRENAISCGLPLDFRAMEELESEEMLRDSIEEIVNASSGPLGEAMAALLADVDLHYVENVLVELYNNRGKAGSWLLEKSRSGTLEGALRSASAEEVRRNVDAVLENEEFRNSLACLLDLQGRAQMIVDAEVQKARTKGREPKPDKAAEYIVNNAALFSALLDCEDNEAAWPLLRQYDETRTNAKGAKIWEDDQDRLKDALSALKGSDLSEERGRIGPRSALQFLEIECRIMTHLATAFEALSELMAREKRRRQAIDFEDMILLTTRLLQDDEPLLRKLGAKYKHILIDEFQDTDTDQANLINMMMRASEQNASRIFIVGDPNQSIYGFRGVDVCHFHRGKEDVVRHRGGEEITCLVNYRSAPSVIHFLNHLFSRVMSGKARDFENEYKEMSCSKARSELNDGSVELMQIEPTGGPRHAAPEEGSAESLSDAFREAGLVADWIKEAVAGGKKRVHDKQILNEGGKKKAAFTARNAEYRDVAILLRSRTNLKYFEKALLDRDIPYRVMEGNGFFQRQEVLDMKCVLAAVYDVHDDIALYGAARSPYLGLTDTQLFPLASDPRPLWTAMTLAAETDKEGDVAKTWNKIKEWSRLSGRLQISMLMRRIIQESDIEVVFGAQLDGERRIVNLQKLVAFAEAMERDGRGSLGEFLDVLAEAARKWDKEGEAQSSGVDADAVKIMTIHASKGLEFPIVVVPQLAILPRSDSRRIGFTELGLGLQIPDPNNGWERTDSALYAAWAEENKARAHAERQRLLYVAMTRAKDHLLLSGGMDGAKTSWMKQIETHLEDCPHLVRSTRSESAWKAKPAAPFRSVEESSALLQAPKPTPPRRRRMRLSASKVKAFEKDRAAYVRSFVVGMPSEIETVRHGLRSVENEGQFCHEVLRGRDPAAVSKTMGFRPETYGPGSLESRRDFEAKRSGLGHGVDRCELPISLTIGEEVFVGDIDRLVLLSGEWKIVDYKRAGGDVEEDRELEEKHALQIEIYREAIRRALGDVGTCHLYLVKGRTMKEMPASPGVIEQVARIAAEIRSLTDDEKMREKDSEE